MDGVCAHTCGSPFEMPRCDTLGARVLIDTPTQHGVKGPIFVLSCAVLRPEYHSIYFTKLHTLYMYIRGGNAHAHIRGSVAAANRRVFSELI